jgi:hypothetical protein
MTGRQARICKQLLDDREETKGSWKFEEEAAARTLWRILLWKRLWNCRKTDYGMSDIDTSLEVCLPV